MGRTRNSEDMIDATAATRRPSGWKRPCAGRTLAGWFDGSRRGSRKGGAGVANLGDAKRELERPLAERKTGDRGDEGRSPGGAASPHAERSLSASGARSKARHRERRGVSRRARGCNAQTSLSIEQRIAVKAEMVRAGRVASVSHRRRGNRSPQFTRSEMQDRAREAVALGPRLFVFTRRMAPQMSRGRKKR